MFVYGMYVMSQLPTWYFNFEAIWTGYPPWKMTSSLKTYYLLHAAYWTQQFLVLALRLEKPRKDFTELVIHHIVTLWLIGWSYLINLTWIGNMVYMTMDISDVFLAASKATNYLQWTTTGGIIFVIFVGVWIYTRHYLNLYMLWSIWYEFDKLPEWTKKWSPKDGVWLAPWMRYQIFIPLVLLQLVNIFWLKSIYRILITAVFSSKLEDERSDDEDEGDEPNQDAKDD